jgi:hypothetical protein
LRGTAIEDIACEIDTLVNLQPSNPENSTCGLLTSPLQNQFLTRCRK